MAAFFVLMLLVVQVGLLTVAQTTASASIDGTARRAAMAPDRLGELEVALVDELRSAIPGAEVLTVSVERIGDIVRVSAELRWTPPGPDLIPLVMAVRRERVVVVPP